MTNKDDILSLVKKYIQLDPPYQKGSSFIPASGKVWGVEEVCSLVEASFDFTHTITDGRISHSFELEFSRFLGTRFSTFCNSGSSANLLAFMALTSPKLGSRAVKPGDEVITSAVGFPTTVAPILQAGCVPVFIDVVIPSYNPSPFEISQAITEKTKVIFLAHTLGNSLNMREIMNIAEQNNLWVIEDCCDGLGGEFGGKKIGTFGDVSTFSFYPAHQMTTGEGGMVSTNSPMLNSIIRSFRDWGRDCWCLTGKDNTCGKRFSYKGMGNLPEGYDHKYVYSHVGYNLKSTDLQASIGIEQLKRLPNFVKSRRDNWEYLHSKFTDAGLGKVFILPSHYDDANPSWFGFALTIRPNQKFTRADLSMYLELHKIGTRNIFGGNITRQPAFQNKQWRKLGDLPKADIVMNNSLWVAVHPGLCKDAMDYMVETFQKFVEEMC